jgi:hypothetical protein
MPDQNMLDRNKDKQLDDLLESMLSSYSNAEPRPGLETRILAQVRHAAEKKSWFWNLGWTGAIAVAIATILLAAYFSRPILRSHPSPLKAVKPVPQITEIVARSTPAIKAPVQHPRTIEVVQEKVEVLAVKDRPAVFPTPVALSEQEKLFFRYLASTPSDEVIAQSHRDEVVDGLPEDQSALPTIVPTKQSVPSSTQ